MNVEGMQVLRKVERDVVGQGQQSMGIHAKEWRRVEIQTNTYSGTLFIPQRRCTTSQLMLPWSLSQESSLPSPSPFYDDGVRVCMVMVLYFILKYQSYNQCQSLKMEHLDYSYRRYVNVSDMGQTWVTTSFQIPFYHYKVFDCLPNSLLL